MVKQILFTVPETQLKEIDEELMRFNELGLD